MNLPDLNAEHESFESYNPRLAERQRRILDSIALARESGVDSGYLNMATATGKTHVAAQDIRHFLADRPEARVLFLCHRNEILDQAEKTFAEILPDHVTHGQIYGGTVEDQAQVVYAGFRQMQSSYEEGRLFEVFDPDEFDYVVVDESHHGPAPTYRDVIEYFRPNFLLGLTATPDRRDEQQISDIFGRELHRLTLEEAIAKGYVSKVDYRVLTDHVRGLAKLDTDRDNLTLPEINNRIFVPKHEEEIVAEIHDHTEGIEDPRLVVFCPDIQTADRMAKLMPQPASPIHYRVSTDEQRERLSQFRSGELRTAVVVDKFNEGVDLPDANVVVFLRATESQMIYLQQLGRGLRKIPGKDEVLALDFVASWERIETIREIMSGAQRYLDTRPSPMPVEVPFRFDFSDEALDAIEVIKYVRDRKRRPKPEKRLSPAERLEQFLGRSISRRRLSESERSRLAVRYKRGDKLAAAEFVERELYLALTAAERSVERGHAFEDSFQVAVLAMAEWVKENGIPVDKKSRQRFSAAMFKSIYDFEAADRVVALPRHTYLKKQRKIEETRAKLEERLGRDATWYEIADATGINPEEAKYISRITEVVRFDDLRVAGKPEADLDQLEIKEMRSVLAESLECLEYRERRVLEMRYGLGNEHPRTLDEVGRAFNVTRERIRQMETQVLKKLQHLSEAQRLRGFQPESGPAPSFYTCIPNPEPETPQRIEFEEAVGGVLPESHSNERRQAYEGVMNERITAMRDPETGLLPSRKAIHRTLQQELPFGNRLKEEEVARFLRRILRYEEAEGRGSERFVSQPARGSMSRGLIPEWEKEA